MCPAQMSEIFWLSLWALCKIGIMLAILQYSNTEAILGETVILLFHP